MTIDLERLASGELRHAADAAEPVVFAAEELRRYFARMFGRAPARRPSPEPGPWLALAVDGSAVMPPPLDDGVEYAVVPAGATGMTIRGASPRALLTAVYAVLEAAGCRWSPHGPADERVPEHGRARSAVSPMEGRPAFARRAYAADLATWHYSVPERLASRLPADVAFIDWMAKSGSTGFLFIRHANDTQWLVPELVPELRRRGLDVEGGGHALVELLPRTLFASHPEYFPVGSDGRRSDLGNMCGSSPEALALVGARARAAIAEIGTRGLHLWGLDLFGGGWCACPGCAPLTASDQLLRVCNEAVCAMGAGSRVFHLAYHDTIRPPRTVRPDRRVWAEFAPRERCYAHALDDPTCATNPPYREALEEHLALFEGRVDVFEYYGDAILFGGCAVPLAGVIARDLAYYARAGVRGVSCLVFGQYSLWAYGTNVEAFARGAWYPPAATAAVRERAARRFGPATEIMVEYLSLLERTMAEIVTYGDVLLPPTSSDRLASVRRAVAGARGQGPSLHRLLAAAHAAGVSHVPAEQHLLDYTLAVVDGVERWLDAVGDRDAADRALASLADAVHHVRAAPAAVTGTWGEHDLEITHHFFAAALRARER